MPTRKISSSLDILKGSFGFNPDESTSHFLVIIPSGITQNIVISEHMSWNPDRIEDFVHYGENTDGQVRSCLDRKKWNAISDVMRADFNTRLKKEGKLAGRSLA